MKKTLLLLAASVACAFPALAQKTYTLTSPDGVFERPSRRAMH